VAFQPDVAIQILPMFAWDMWCPNKACNLPVSAQLDLVGAFTG